MAAVAACGMPARNRLSRAGWNVISGSSLPGLPSTPTDWRADGRRLIKEVASTWSRKYIFTVRDGEYHDGMYHYECLFSLPTNERPVPSNVVAVLFAFLRPAQGNEPRLFYSFEESDLRHEWKIISNGKGGWQAQVGKQQVLSLKGSNFEGFLDFYIREKDKVRARGTDVSTAFERSRFEPPPAAYRDEEEGLFASEAPYIEEFATSNHSDRANSRGERPSSHDFHRQTSNMSTVASHHRRHTQAAVVLKEKTPAQLAQEADRAEVAAMMTTALRAANMHCDLVAPPATLAQLLSCIFDAADEEGQGAMGHYEVARLMMAVLPGFGLHEWDINHLLSSADEDDEGFINLADFTKFAPDRMSQLRQQRAIFLGLGKAVGTVSEEAIQHCYEDELRITADELVKVFEAKAAEDPTRGQYLSAGARGSDGEDEAIEKAEGTVKDLKLVALKRKYCREAIAALTERISPQEGSMLLQMLPEDEAGFLNFENIGPVHTSSQHPGELSILESLRTQTLLNAVVGNHLRSLRIHLVHQARKCGLDWTGKLKVWKVKDILLTADQLCLSRMQIHTLLCMSDPRKNGDVDVQDFMHVCAAVIPHMTNAQVFQLCAEKLMSEHAEAAKEAQNAQMAALGAPTSTSKKDHDDEDFDKAPPKEVDRDTVERTFLQSFALLDKTGKSTPTLRPEQIFDCVFNGSDAQVQGLCLDEMEVAGLMGEMVPDASGEVPYHDFVRRWVPIMFELRQHPLLSRYLLPTAVEQLGIREPDRAGCEAVIPLLTPDMVKPVAHHDHVAHVHKAAPAPESPADAAVVRRMGSKDKPGMRRRGTISKQNTLEESPEKHPAVLPPPGRGFMRRKFQMEADKTGQDMAALAEKMAKLTQSP